VPRLCVFCGSSPGARPAYGEAAEELGRLLVAQGIGLVYGGGAVGLMGRLADAVLAEGGEAIGVLPEALVAKEIGHPGLPDLRVVGSMHERKALMADLADGFVALPGGLGTVEELFEVYTWAQLGLDRKPCALLDVEGYYEGIANFLAHAVEERFLRDDHRSMLIVERTPSALLERLKRYEPEAVVPKWIDREQTDGNVRSMSDAAVGDILVQRDELEHRVRELAAEISRDYADRELLLVGVLKGAVFFLADLMRHLEVACEVDFMAVSSYGASTDSSGVVRILKDLDAPIEGRDVLIVEDIVDSGLTLSYLFRMLRARGPASLEVCALLTKPARREIDLPIRYVGFEIPNRFAIGYGLDYAERYRNLPYVAVLAGESG
jgi:hypoxanthine phosphoribosyltransferase